MKTNILAIALIASMLTVGCQQGTNNQNEKTDTGDSNATSTAFDGVIDNKDVKLYGLQNGNLSVSLTNYGARLVSLNVPNKTGASTDVILGYESAQEYKD